MEYIVTLRQLQEWGACVDRYKVLVKGLGHENLDTPVAISRILSICGVQDATWVLFNRRTAKTKRETLHAFQRDAAFDVAKRILKSKSNAVNQLVRDALLKGPFVGWFALRYSFSPRFNRVIANAIRAHHKANAG